MNRADTVFPEAGAIQCSGTGSSCRQDNMKGPGMTTGAKGMGKAVYFKDPDGHVLEIKTY